MHHSLVIITVLVHAVHIDMGLSTAEVFLCWPSPHQSGSGRVGVSGVVMSLRWNDVIVVEWLE